MRSLVSGSFEHFVAQSHEAGGVSLGVGCRWVSGAEDQDSYPFGDPSYYACGMWDVLRWEEGVLSIAWWFMLVVLFLLFGLIGWLGRR